MHEMSVFWLRAAAALYAIGLLATIQTVLRRRSSVSSAVLGAFCVGVVFHFVSLVEISYITRSLPAHNFFETISLCAFLFAILFLFVYWRYQFHGLSIVLFPMVFLMTLVGGMQTPVGSWSTRTARDAWLIAHVVLVLLGYAALLLTAVASIFYLVQERHLKTKRPAGFFGHLPPLGTLDNLMSRSMTLGFVLITLGLITGITWAFIETGTQWLSDPRIFVSFIAWGVSLLMVFLRLTAGWRGRKAAILAVTVLGCSAATWITHAGIRSLRVQ